MNFRVSREDAPRGTFSKVPLGTPQNLWCMGKLLSLARRFRKIFPLTDRKTTHTSSVPKVFEDSKETFSKKFLWRGVGRRPTSASPPINPNLKNQPFAKSDFEGNQLLDVTTSEKRGIWYATSSCLPNNILLDLST